MAHPSQLRPVVYAQFTRIAKAIAHPARLELLELLAQGPHHIDGLAREAGISLASASQHLQVLRAARLVEATREGSFVVCRLADPKVSALLASLRDLAESRLLEIDEVMKAVLGAERELELVASRELLARVRKGEVVLLDVRPDPEFQAGHLPRALSVPLAELERRLSELPKNREIVAYCRGPYCLLAVRAVELLRDRGWRASRLRDGVPEWRAAGLPVDETPSQAAPTRRRTS